MGLGVPGGASGIVDRFGAAVNDSVPIFRAGGGFRLNLPPCPADTVGTEFGRKPAGTGDTDMRGTRKLLAVAAAGIGAFGLAGLTGCQTHMNGLTLPSPHYLEHPPQYFPPDPSFPLQREVDSMQDPDGAFRRGGGAAAPVLPPAVPPAVAAPVPAGK